jgi:Flp pilus assembly protein TadD
MSDPHPARHLRSTLLVAAAAWVGAAGGGPGRAADLSNVQSLIATGNAAAAIAPLEARCRVRDDDLAARFSLAYCYAAAGRLEEARQSYEKCAALDADRPEIHYNLGVVLNRLGFPGAAARSFEEALLLDPGWGEANFNCGLAYYSAHRPVPAIKYFREARTLAPEDVHVLYCLALAYEDIDPRVALSLWEDYLREAAEAAVDQPYLKLARQHLAALRAGKKP